MTVAASAEILQTHTSELFQAAVRRASALLRAGEVVALPTETVYGLAANAFDARAVSRIFEVKGRPSQNPIIVHVADLEMAGRCVSEWPPAAEQLAASFWPGPLTLVLPRSREIPDCVTAGGPTVGVRWPSHPFVQAVIRECEFPLAAPSANLSNRLSPTNAEHVRSQLGDKVGLIIDGGQAQVGIESTVLDLTVRPPRVLRPGMIHEEALQAALRLSRSSRPEETGQTSGTLRSPGLLRKHYAPKAKLIVMSWRDDADLRSRLGSERADRTHVIAYQRIPSPKGLGGVSVIPHDAEAFARALYAELHRCDEAGAERIIVEAPPDSTAWRAIVDRLNRAAVRDGV